jgi:hypothetical protein
MTERTGQGDRTRPVTTGQTVTIWVRESCCRDRTRCTRRPVGVQRAPTATVRVRSQVTKRATHPISSSPRSDPLGARPDAPVPWGTGRAGRALFFCAQVNWPDVLVMPDQRPVTNPRHTVPLPLTWADRTRMSTLDRVRSLFFSEKHTGLTPPFLRLQRSRK